MKRRRRVNNQSDDLRETRKELEKLREETETKTRRRILDKAFFLGAEVKEMDYEQQMAYEKWAMTYQMKAMLLSDDKIGNYPQLQSRIEQLLKDKNQREGDNVSALVEILCSIQNGGMNLDKQGENTLYGIYSQLVRSKMKPYSALIGAELDAAVTHIKMDNNDVFYAVESGKLQRQIKDSMLFWPYETTISLCAYQMLLPAIFHSFCPLVPLEDGESIEMALERAQKKVKYMNGFVAHRNQSNGRITALFTKACPFYSKTC